MFRYRDHRQVVGLYATPSVRNNFISGYLCSTDVVTAFFQDGKKQLKSPNDLIWFPPDGSQGLSFFEKHELKQQELLALFNEGDERAREKLAGGVGRCSSKW